MFPCPLLCQAGIQITPLCLHTERVLLRLLECFFTLIYFLTFPLAYWKLVKALQIFYHVLVLLLMSFAENSEKFSMLEHAVAFFNLSFYLLPCL